MMATIAERTEPSAPYERWNEGRVRRDRARPRLHRRPQRLPRRRAARARRARRPHALGPLGAPDLRPPPEVPIYALSPGRETVRRCGLMWGVQAASMRRYEVTEELIARAAARVVELGWCQARPARRHHGRAAERPAGDDEPAAGHRRLRRSGTRPLMAIATSRPRDDRLRAEVVQAAAQRRVGERAGRRPAVAAANVRSAIGVRPAA